MFREPLTPVELGDTWSQTWTNFEKIGKSGILLTAVLLYFPNLLSQDSTFFCVELSPTSRYIFYPDFFLRKDELKLHRGKIIDLGEIFIFEMKISNSRANNSKLTNLDNFENPLPLKNANNIFSKDLFTKMIFFLGGVLLYLYAEKKSG